MKLELVVWYQATKRCRQQQASYDLVAVGNVTVRSLYYNSSLLFSPQSFSISRIEGALCDEGQNYKNLVGFVKGLQKDYSDKIVFGCAKDFGM